MLRFISTIKTSARGKLNQHRHDLTQGEFVPDATIGNWGYDIGVLLRDLIPDLSKRQRIAKSVQAWKASHPTSTRPAPLADEIAAVEARIVDAIDDDLMRLTDCLMRLREMAATIVRRESTLGGWRRYDDVVLAAGSLCDFIRAKHEVDFAFEFQREIPTASTIRNCGCRPG